MCHLRWHAQDAEGLSDAGKATAGDSFKGWEEGKRNFTMWLDMAYKSEVPVIVWTCWAAAERVDELSLETNPGKVKKGYYPDLIGKDQREILGEYPVIYQYVEGGKAYWQLVGMSGQSVGCGATRAGWLACRTRWKQAGPSWLRC